MKDLAHVLHKDANTRLKEVHGLIEGFKSSEKIKQIMQDWMIEVKSQPTQFEAQKIEKVKILMGNNYEFDGDFAAQQFERNTQKQMYKQPPLTKWALFYGSQQKREAKSLLSSFQECIKDSNYDCKPPREFEI